MKSFAYQARNAQGQLISGKIESESADNAAAAIFNKGLTPIKITAGKKTKRKGKKSGFASIEITPKKVKPEDFSMWCRQMATLSKAGVPILVCLEQTAEHTEKTALQNALLGIVESISGGQTLAAAIAKHPKVFKPVMVSIIDAGEQSGQLEEAFTQLSTYYELETKTRRRIKSATRYPTMVIMAVLVGLGVINFMVIPTFAQLYSRYDAQLPAITRFLMNMSSFCINYWPWMLGGVIVIVFLLKRYFKTEKGRFFKDKYLLKVPIIGPLIFQINISRFARAFTMTLKAGVPLVSAITLVSNTIGNAYIQSKMMRLKEGAQRGESLSKCAAEVNLLSPLATQMLRTGEESGNIEEMLEQVAVFYEEDIDYKLANLSQAIEPILLVIMGVMVLILALGVFLPLWDMTSFADKG